ncbi:amyloid-beta A4 precursor protein-binding family A member 2 [Astyanax mexicanus]|uniref:amyloid-beta A4 precursor protein-binding family A member 2 n=1 Tax=Astyanax mexicanus TaxID=7994 RepID=UPI0020CB17D4|nr:amyloid-beta A4 precursor protein-binding family A member 2 [Astyanax mexicanus]XP_022527956.2 amyloid-beta A4 precursor protein-binding family A member 2 [Astyanax mexicanus]
MALRRGQGIRANVPEPDQSPAPEQSGRPSKDREDSEEPHSSTVESQSSTPVPDSLCPSDGSVSREDSLRGESPIQPDSMEDSLSEYDNVGSEEEEEEVVEEEEEQDYEEDEELRTDADGMTYYVHCCPEDESYMEGMDCHEGADSGDRPSTSRDPDGGRMPAEAWANSEGFYEVLQQGKEQMMYKCPEPISETAFIQAPMAEDEEDEEEAEEVEEDEDEEDDEEEEDEEEEDDKYFVYEGEKAEEDQDEFPSKESCDLPEDNRNLHQRSSYTQEKIREEEDLPGDYRGDKRRPENCRGDNQGSSSCHREGIKKANAEERVNYPRDCEVGKADRNLRQGSRLKGQQTWKEDSGNRDCPGGSGDNGATKHEDPVNRADCKKRHMCRRHGEEERESRHLHMDNDSPEKCIGKGKGLAHSNYRAKARRDKPPAVDAEGDVDQIVNGVRAKLKLAPQNTKADRGVTGQSPDKRGIPDSSKTSSLSSQKGESRPRAPNTAVKPPDPQLQKDQAKAPVEEEWRSSQGQIVQSSPQHGTVNPNTEMSNHNLPQQGKRNPSFPSFVDVPGPCEPEDLIDGIIFAANYLGSTQLLSDRNPSKSVRMMQAQEAVDRVKCLDGESQSLTEVDLFISTKAIKVLNADTQETMMDNALRTISYIADIGSVVVLMARRRMSHSASLDCTDTGLNTAEGRKQYRMICYVFESEDAQLIAQSIGQAFSMAYQEFLRANGINPKDLSQKDYSDILNTQEMYNDDLIHFSNSENCKEVNLEKQKGEILGVVIVESGWGSILPTVILACMLNSGPAARSGKLNVGDQIMAVNDTSLVGLPLATCQGIIKGLKSQVQVKLSVVSCPPVTTVLIKRPDLQYQLGFSVQNGIICSLMRGGIAERGGVRVGHRIIEINGQSVVAMAHEKIVHALSVSVGEIHMKTMPAVMFRLLTGQETPVYI